MGVLGG
jgi:hypothetical protein